MKRWPWQWRRQLEQAEERARRAESELWALSEQPIRQIADSLRKRVEELEAYKKDAEPVMQAMAEELYMLRTLHPQEAAVWRAEHADEEDPEYDAIMRCFAVEDEARKADAERDLTWCSGKD